MILAAFHISQKEKWNSSRDDVTQQQHSWN